MPLTKYKMEQIQRFYDEVIALGDAPLEPVVERILQTTTCAHHVSAIKSDPNAQYHTNKLWVYLKGARTVWRRLGDRAHAEADSACTNAPDI